MNAGYRWASGVLASVVLAVSLLGCSNEGSPAGAPNDADSSSAAVDGDAASDRLRDQEAAAEDTQEPDNAPSATPPGLNELERSLIAALDRLGVTASPAEHSFRGANLWAQLGHGRELYVNAVPQDAHAGAGEVIDERRLAGLTVQTVAYGAGDTRQEFVCGEHRYEVSGSTPESFDGFDDFLVRFIRELDCS